MISHENLKQCIVKSRVQNEVAAQMNSWRARCHISREVDVPEGAQAASYVLRVADFTEGCRGRMDRTKCQEWRLC